MHTGFAQKTATDNSGGTARKQQQNSDLSRQLALAAKPLAHRAAGTVKL